MNSERLERRDGSWSVSSQVGAALALRGFSLLTGETMAFGFTVPPNNS
jgi:hypothetical protein